MFIWARLSIPTISLGRAWVSIDAFMFLAVFPIPGKSLGVVFPRCLALLPSLFFYRNYEYVRCFDSTVFPFLPTFFFFSIHG